MKKITLFIFLLIASFGFSQNWTTGQVSLDPGDNFTVQFDINEGTNVVTMTMIGNQNVWLAVAPGVSAGNGMGNAGDDCIVYSSSGLSDRNMPAGTGTPFSDGINDWTIVSNNTAGGLVTVIATRAVNTGNAGDFVFPTSAQALPILWAHGNGTTSFGYHGFSNKAGALANITLSNEDFQLNPVRFNISPNPSNRDLNIGINYESTRNYNVEVFDVLGKQIYRGQLTKDDTSIDASNWRSGVYLVKLSSDQVTLTKRFVKQ